MKRIFPGLIILTGLLLSPYSLFASVYGNYKNKVFFHAEYKVSAAKPEDSINATAKDANRGIFFSVNSLKNHDTVSLNDLQDRLSETCPGDTVVIRNGIYRDIELKLHACGEAGKMIVVIAQEPGKVIVEGRSRIGISGCYLEINGFWFRNGYSPNGVVIEYRNGSKAASNCRVTNCVIQGFNPRERSETGNWVQLYGQFNRFDHNSVYGKLNKGVIVAAVLNGVTGQNHIIDNNYFGPRPVLGSNGGEIIRTGNSFTCRTQSNIIIKDNYFDRCDGEVEVISVKSTGNTLRNNVFYECQGALVLRHGDNNIVESNVFLGNKKPHTGGIRIVNSGHKIRNNYFERLAGEGAYAPLSIMNGVPDSPDFRYCRVKDVEISDNVFNDCSDIVFCLGADYERTEVPLNVNFTGNTIIHPDNNYFQSRDDVSGITLNNNKVNFTDAGGLAKLKLACKGIDMTTYGALWYRGDQPGARELNGNVLKVHATQNSLAEAVKKSSYGDIIELCDAADYWNDKTISIDHYIMIRAAGVLKSKPRVRYNGKAGLPVIEIADGGDLDISGLSFCAIPEKELADPKGFISTATSMINHYTLFVDNCEFHSTIRSDTYAISCTTGSFADWIKIRNSKFHNLAWDAIDLSKENDNEGCYNVSSFELDNCQFADISGTAVNLTRLGYDESTYGPCVKIYNCSFKNVFNRELGSVIDLRGVQEVIVDCCSFDNSGRGGSVIRLEENKRDKVSITNINLWKSGKIFIFGNAFIKGPVTYNEPEYEQ